LEVAFVGQREPEYEGNYQQDVHRMINDVPFVPDILAESRTVDLQYAHHA